jgi:hypothetical protein
MEASILERATVTVASGDFSLKALQFEGGSVSTDRESLLMLAVHYYLADGGSGRAGWRYPRFRTGEPRENAATEMPANLDEKTLTAFTQEAERQDVWVEQLLEHAVLYFIADLDAGRVTRRIYEDLGGKLND